MQRIECLYESRVQWLHTLALVSLLSLFLSLSPFLKCLFNIQIKSLEAVLQFPKSHDPFVSSQLNNFLHISALSGSCL